MRTWGLALLAVGLLAGPAAGSELSKRLTARGLVQFHAGHYAQALPLFDEAVGADSGDPYARYYRGVTYGWLGNYDAAITDLHAVALARPDIKEVPLELGVVLFQKTAYEEAVPWLEAAQEVARTEAKASLFLGIAQFRLGRGEAARASFARAAARDPSLHDAVQYYLGVAEYTDGNYAAAETYFHAVADVNPLSEIGREATRFLRTISRMTHSTYEVFGAAGFQYDSNVVIAPSSAAISDALGISNQADGRSTLDFGGRYVPWRTDRTRLTVGYEFYQSLHIDLSEFNLQDHRVTADLTTSAGRVLLDLLGAYDYYFLSKDSFLHEMLVAPTATLPEGEFGRTEVGYRMRRRNFFKQPYSDTRDAFNNEAAVRQFFYLGSPNRYFTVGYRFDREDTSHSPGDEFAYDGHEVNGGFGWMLPLGIMVETGYARRFESYAPQSDGREDNEHRIAAVFRRDLTEYVRLLAGYFGTLNHSNDQRFAYDRHIGSIALEGRFWQ